MSVPVVFELIAEQLSVFTRWMLDLKCVPGYISLVDVMASII